MKKYAALLCGCLALSVQGMQRAIDWYSRPDFYAHDVDGVERDRVAELDFAIQQNDITQLVTAIKMLKQLDNRANRLPLSKASFEQLTIARALVKDTRLMYYVHNA